MADTNNVKSTEVNSPPNGTCSAVYAKPSFAELARKAASTFQSPSAPVGIVVEVNRPQAKDAKARNSRRTGKKSTKKEPGAKQEATGGNVDSGQTSVKKAEASKSTQPSSKPTDLTPAILPKVNVWEQRMQEANRQLTTNVGADANLKGKASKFAAENQSATTNAVGTRAYPNGLTDSWPSLQKSLMLTPPTSPQGITEKKPEVLATDMERMSLSISPASPPLSEIGDDEAAVRSASKESWKAAAEPAITDGNLPKSLRRKTSFRDATISAEKVSEYPNVSAPSSIGGNVKANLTASLGSEGSTDTPVPSMDVSASKDEPQSSRVHVNTNAASGKGDRLNYTNRRRRNDNGLQAKGFGKDYNGHYGNRGSAKVYVSNGAADSKAVVDYHQMMLLGFENTREWVKYQIEYYFSTENLCKDMFLRKSMDSEGYVPLRTILNFNRMQALLFNGKPFATYVMGADGVDAEKSSDSEKKLLLDESWVMPLILDCLKDATLVELLCKDDKNEQENDDRIWFVRKAGDWANFCPQSLALGAL